MDSQGGLHAKTGRHRNQISTGIVVSDGLWEWNLKTNGIIYSSCWKRMLGYDDDSLADHLDTLLDRILPPEKAVFLSAVENYLSGSVDTLFVEMQLQHKDGHTISTLCRGCRIDSNSNGEAIRLIGSHTNLANHLKSELQNANNADILQMIALGKPAKDIYAAIALMYEGRHPGMRCSMLELEGDTLLHGGAPSLPKQYCDAIHGLKIGPNIGSCGTSTYTGQRCLVANIETDPKWTEIKHLALPHGMRCCWSEPIKSSVGKVLGAFGMYYDCTGLPNQHQSADLVTAAGLASVVMERDQNQKRINILAYTDELTGLANRSRFYLELEKFIEEYSQKDQKFCLIYMDLDNFKHVNDSLGHDTGDLMLQEIALRLTSIGGQLDYTGRLGGDEFCMIIRLGDEEGAAIGITDHIMNAINQPLELSARKLLPLCSLGVACFPQDGNNIRSLMKAADTALYAAKEQGKNRYVFYESELSHQLDHRLQTERLLREAIEDKQLSLDYQPLIDLSKDQVIGVEALCRWKHPELGEVGPAEFIPIAERIGMIKPLTEWALSTACNQLMAWKQAGLPNLAISVNMSPSLFLDNTIVDLIQEIINKTEITPPDLILEITESVVQTASANLNVFIALKELGVVLAVDDFGMGYSSLASLKHLHVDYLKIDKYFIQDMVTCSKSEVLVQSIIDMGHKLGHQIIAEGIETEEQLTMLKKMGCCAAQGYLIGRPVSPDKIAAALINNAGSI